jgi:hypothetical protein
MASVPWKHGTIGILFCYIEQIATVFGFLAVMMLTEHHAWGRKKLKLAYYSDVLLFARGSLLKQPK